LITDSNNSIHPTNLNPREKLRGGGSLLGWSRHGKTKPLFVVDSIGDRRGLGKEDEASQGRVKCEALGRFEGVFIVKE